MTTQLDISTSIYTPLEPDFIRVLHLQPGERDDSVFIEISREKLVRGEIRKYNALSWQWDDKSVGNTIRIKNMKDIGSQNDIDSHIWSVNIRSNLLHALKHLRKDNAVVRLWVDALCINQENENNGEKSQQISLMTKIYGMAEEVCVWLGNASDDSATAMKFVKKLVNLDDVNHIAGLERSTTNYSHTANELAALIKLLKRGWFSRRWVVQEIAVAKKAIVHCGADYVSWHELADAIALLEKVGRDGTINRILRTLVTPTNPVEDIGSFSSLPAYRLVQNSTGMFRGRDSKSHKTWRYTLQELVTFLAAFEASRLHDTIYALLGLASDVGPGPTSEEGVRMISNGTFNNGKPEDVMDVNYNIPPLEVFKKFLSDTVKRSQSLDILCRPWAPSSGVDADGKLQNITLPSWITSLSRKPFQPTRQGNMVRFNADPLVGPATFRHKQYSASASEPLTFEYVEADQPQSTLRVKGFQLGVIGEMWDCGEFGNIPSSWLQAGGWKESSGLPPDELWRTLVADRNANGDDPDRWYPMVFQSAVKERGIVYGLETRQLIHESTNAMVAELFRRVEAVIWNRRLIRGQGGFTKWLAGKKNGSKEEDEKLSSSLRSLDRGALGLGSSNAHKGEKASLPLYKEPIGLVPSNAEKDENSTSLLSDRGALGLVPSDAQKGDHICIIFGCTVPLILRRTRSKQPIQQQQQDMPVVRQPTVESSSMNDSQPAHPQTTRAAVIDTVPESTVQGENERYTLIGECYLDHMMDGEAMAYYANEEIQDQNFILE